jgi:hypothetical protein
MGAINSITNSVSSALGTDGSGGGLINEPIVKNVVAPAATANTGVLGGWLGGTLDKIPMSQLAPGLNMAALGLGTAANQVGTAANQGGTNVAIPDYAAMAAADLSTQQKMLEAQTKANRPNQYSPYGSSTWKQDPTTGQWSQTVETGQAGTNYQNQMNAQGQQVTAGQGLLGQGITDASKGLNTNGLPAWQQYQNPTQNVDVNSVMGQANNQMGMNPGQNFNPNTLSQFGQAGQAFDPSRLGAAPQAGTFGMDPTGNSKAIQDATYALLSPQRQQQRDGEIQRLKNQGLTEDSPAFQRAMQRVDQGDTQAQMQALLAGQTEYGNAFSRGMGQNQQNFNQGLNLRGQLANEQAQTYGQQSTNANLANTIRAQMAGEQQQQYGQQATTAAFNNQANSTNFGQNLQAQNLAMALRGQQATQGNAAADQANAMRGQMLNEQSQLNNYGLNQARSLLGDPNASMPQFNSFATQGVGQSNTLDAAQQQYQAQLNASNASTAQKSSQNKGIGGLLGAGIGGYFGGLPGATLGASVGGGLLGGLVG